MAYYGKLRHPHQGKIYTSIRRPAPDDIRRIAATYTGLVVDRIGKYGVMDHSIKPLTSSMRLCGPAITVLGPDLSVRRMAADLAQPGDVLVIAAGGTQDYACFGDGTALKMSLRGVSGVVIDGMTRDADRLKSMGFPCFCKGTNLRNYDYPVFARYGAVNVPISCGNTIVNPGDLVFGDADGVLVIPRDFVPKIASHLLDDFLEESAERVALDGSFRFAEDANLKSRDYEFIDGEYEV